MLMRPTARVMLLNALTCQIDDSVGALDSAGPLAGPKDLHTGVRQLVTSCTGVACEHPHSVPLGCEL